MCSCPRVVNPLSTLQESRSEHCIEVRPVANHTSRLWGNPEHLKFLTNSLRDKHGEDKVHILVVKRNAGSFTYDGVETGGERVANEIEETLEELSGSGHEITKLSITGYSFGGLISRYAIGLLYTKGLFERIQPMVRWRLRNNTPFLTLAEFHNLCHSSPGSPNTTSRIPQSSLEQLGSSDTLFQRETTVSNRLV
jgi:hypothetical protein